jgi:serine/threonine protein phosphatase PrpC
MTLELRYAVRSDVGLLREGNEDSAYAGSRLLAVADGMGGHAAGEVASAVAIAALADLDDDMPPSELQIALSTAVAHANQILHDMVSADPSISGMGTTLTAMLWSDGKVALCHIGDSRAYVLSGGEFQQITHDHTLVQSLVDDGRISPDEAATHPQRSLLLRALDGTSEAEPDLSILEAHAGDRYLLCSDGLSGVVSEETLHRTLATVPNPEDAVLQLVELAIRGGGPDNITCIVADVVDSATAPRQRGNPSVLAGAASNGGRPTIRTDSPAARAHLLSQTQPQAPIVVDHEDPAPRLRNGHDEEDTEPARRRWPIVRSLFVLLLILIIGGGYLGWRYTQDQYYVGTADGQVAIFQGVNQSVAGVNLSHVYQRTDIPLAGVPSSDQGTIRATVPASTRGGALAIVANVRKQYEACLAAYQAEAKYQTDLTKYNAAKAAYKKKWGDLKSHRLPKNRGTVHPPTFTETQPTIPPGCPGPAATGGSTGSGGSS